MRPNKDRQNLWLLAAFLLPLLWLAAGVAQITEQAHGLSALAEGLTALLNDPLSLRWCSSTPKFLLAVLVLYPLGVYCYLLDQADRRPGEEHGSAHWGNAGELNERYRNRKDPWQEIILSQNIRLSNDSYQHQRNLHVVVIGGSGSGKTRFFVKPNALQCSGSYFFLDPKGELTYSLGGAMEENGVTVTVIDFVHFRGHYNPVAYLKTDEDAMKLAYALVFNTKKNPAASGGENEFWDKSAVMFLASLILYILYESPLYERNLNTMMDMILECKVSEDSYDENRMDILFGELEQRDPHHPAVLQYRSFKLGSAKTLSSIMVTAVSNLHMLQSAAFAEMIATDEMFLPKLGVEKRAIFCVIPDNDDTFNFMVSILYTQLFDQLFRLADSTPEFHGTLPVHVRLMMDEFANVATPENFVKILAVARSRNISCDIILQNISQIKSKYKDERELGLLIETTVYKHLVSFYQGTGAQLGYYRKAKENQKEVDAVIELPQQKILCEVKYKNNSHIPQTDGIVELCNDPKAGITDAFVITKQLEDFGVTRHETSPKIYRIPAIAFLYLIGKEESDGMSGRL